MEHSLGLLMMKTTSIDLLNEFYSKHQELKVVSDSILLSINLLINSFKNGNKLLCCGNGGSAADCEHIVGELLKGFVCKRSLDSKLKAKINDNELSDALEYGLPAISLVSQTSFTTAFANDKLASAVFAQQVLAYGKKDDVLLCISTSGESLNCIYAAKVARALGVKVISLTGSNPSKLSSLSDIIINAPKTETYKIQELHLPIYHIICLVIENEFFGE